MPKRNLWLSKVYPRLSDIEAWASQGDTDAMMAEKLGISTRSFRRYKQANWQLSEVLERGRDKLCAQVKSSLFTLAMGCVETVDTKKIVDVDPTTGRQVITTRQVTTKEPNLRAITLLLSNYDTSFHADPDGYDLKKRALEIQAQHRTTTEDNWTAL